MKTKGFTLVELLVVIAIIALLMGILMPALARVRQIAFRMVCGTNLSGIGKAMLIYANDYEDELPRAGGRGSVWGGPVMWNAANRNAAYGLAANGTGGKATISSCFYLLVKYAEVTPKSFICKSDSGTSEFKLSNETGAGNMEFIDCWDFGIEPLTHCSYTYHMPFGLYALTTSSEPGMAVAGDRSPWLASPAASAKTIANFNPTSTNIDQQKYGNSISHQEDGQNVLFMDSHVFFEKRSFCAINDDNVYTFWDGGDIRRGGAPVVGATEPKDRKDSFLVHDGPAGTKDRFCFPADTLVWVDGAPVEISQVTQGQKVSILEAAGLTSAAAQPVSLRQIERIEQHEGTFDCYDVALETGDSISAVGSHRFLLDSQRWVPVQDLKAGWKLMSLKGPVGIKSVAKRATPLVGRVYNLKIQNTETYCVGKAGLIVRDW
jgi:prepilin-type N-terminal cleavage/methylation domain-containing protein